MFLREYLTLRRSPTSSIASRACWMITASKSIPCAADAIDGRELIGCVRERRHACWGNTRVSLFESPANSHHVYKVNRVVQNRKSRKHTKRREISCHCSLDFRPTFNWPATVNTIMLWDDWWYWCPKALGQCNPELLWLISPYPAFPWCVKLKDKFLLSPRSVKWPGIPRSLQLRFFSTFHEKRLCNKTLNTFEWLSSKHEYPAFCYFKNYCLYMRGLSHKICH